MQMTYRPVAGFASQHGATRLDAIVPDSLPLTSLRLGEENGRPYNPDRESTS